MPFYVALLHLKPLGLQTPKTSLKAIETAIAARGGIIRAVNDAGRRPLPYAFKGKGADGKFIQSNVVTVEFAGKPKEMRLLNKALMDMSDVLRVNILRAEETLLSTFVPS